MKIVRHQVGGFLYFYATIENNLKKNSKQESKYFVQLNPKVTNFIYCFKNKNVEKKKTLLIIRIFYISTG